MQAYAAREGLYMVYAKDNRTYCQPLKDFEADPANLKLPMFDSVPFLKENSTSLEQCFGDDLNQ